MPFNSVDMSVQQRKIPTTTVDQVADIALG